MSAGREGRSERTEHKVKLGRKEPKKTKTTTNRETQTRKEPQSELHDGTYLKNMVDSIKKNASSQN